MIWNKRGKGVTKKTANSRPVTVIKPRSGWQAIDFDELKEYSGLLFSFAWRDVKAMYAQAILGLSWAIIQPLVQIIIFTIVFGKVAKISTDGIPYPVFLSSAMIPWHYMAQAISQSSESLIKGQHMLGKIYFPRLIFPIAPLLSKLLNFGISLIILLAIMVYYRVYPGMNVLWLPVFLFMMVLIAAAGGLWLSSIAIRFRDVRHAMPFFIQLLMYTGPIVYPLSAVPEKYRILYSLNPIVGVIEGFRTCLIGLPVVWANVWPGMITGSVLFIAGALYFRRMERIFVDVI
jgi:lipopolysaccharide transport system permease protein